MFYFSKGHPPCSYVKGGLAPVSYAKVRSAFNKDTINASSGLNSQVPKDYATFRQAYNSYVQTDAGRVHFSKVLLN